MVFWLQEKEIKRLKLEGKENLSLISLQLLELQVKEQWHQSWPIENAIEQICICPLLKYCRTGERYFCQLKHHNMHGNSAADPRTLFIGSGSGKLQYLFVQKLKIYFPFRKITELGWQKATISYIFEKMFSCVKIVRKLAIIESVHLFFRIRNTDT